MDAGDPDAAAVHPDPRLRADAIDVLGLTRDPAALPLIEPALKDPDQQAVARRLSVPLRVSTQRNKTYSPQRTRWTKETVSIVVMSASRVGITTPAL